MPTNWRVKIQRKDPDAVCTISVDPPNQKQLTDANNGVYLFGFTVEVRPGPFDEALQKDGGFEQEDGKWYVLGRQGMRSPATRINGHGWDGVRGTASSGCFHEGGGYAGLCEFDAAFVGNAKWSASIYSRPQSAQEFAKALATFRFE